MRYLLPALPLTLVLATPATASTTAAAGPSPTPLIVEVVVAALVIGGIAVRTRMARVLAALPRVSRARRRAWVRARGA
jgi:hypothetical protein